MSCKQPKEMNETALLKARIEQLEKENSQLRALCLENEEAMYDAVIKGNDNRLIELVEEGFCYITDMKIIIT